MSLPAYSPSTKVTAPTDAFCPCAPLLSPRDYLPHIVRSITALGITKPSVNLCLAEDTVYVRPKMHVDDADDRGCAGASTSDVRGGAILRGLVSVVSTKARAVEDIVLSLEAESRVAVQKAPSENHSAFARLLSFKELGGLELVQLQKGINTFEFSLLVPSSAPATIKACTYGRLRYILSARVPGSGTLLKGDLFTQQEIVVVHVPDRIEGPDLSFEDEVADDLVWSGPKRVQVGAEALTIGGDINFSLSLPSPPPGLTIFGARAYIRQAVASRSTARDDQVTIIGPKRVLCSRGHLNDWQSPTFVSDALQKHEQALLLVPARATASKEDGWSMRCSGTIDFGLRPTTLCPRDKTDAGLSFSAEIVLDVFFSSADGADAGRLMIASVYRKPVTLLSEKCAGTSLVLPEYSA